MNRVLLTGASGFIGCHVLNSLIKLNYQVDAIYSNRDPFPINPNVCWHKINLLDEFAIQDLFKKIKPDYLLHLAWYTKPGYWNSPLNIDWYKASIRLLESFIETGGRRCIFVGSCAEYNWKHGICQEYSTVCNSRSVYGKTKHALYSLSEVIAEQHQLSFAWARIFFSFGAHEHLSRFVPAIICNLLNKKQFVITNGNNYRDYLFVEDVADALIALLSSNVNGPVNIASGKKIGISELANIIAEKLRCENLIQIENKESYDNEGLVVADVQRLLTEVKWQAKYSINAALDKTIDWWRTQV